MEFKYSRDADGPQRSSSTDDSKRQTSMLLVLLVLVGGFAYLYFFTDIIKPLEETNKPAPQAVIKPVVKIPLPPRDAEPANSAVKSSDKPSATPPDLKISADKAVTAESKKPDKEKVPVASAQKTVSNVKSTDEPKRKVASDKSATKSIQKNETKAAPAAAGKSSSESWVILVGSYVNQGALSADMALVRKAGYDPVIKAAAPKKTTMHRLLVSDHEESSAALAVKEKLKMHTSDVFVMKKDGRYLVLAGSYTNGDSAGAEMERLNRAGFNITVVPVEIAVPAHALTTGPFTSNKDAAEALLKLKKAGLTPTLSTK